MEFVTNEDKSLVYELCVEPLTLIFNLFIKLKWLMKLSTALALFIAFTLYAASPTIGFTIGCVEQLAPAEVKKVKQVQIAKYEKELIHTTQDFIKVMLPLVQEAHAAAIANGYKVPKISVTLAQAILESRSGKSRLFRTSNNAFGIKANEAWLKAGKPIVRFTDDAPNEAFCKFKSVETSIYGHVVTLNKSIYVRQGVFKATTAREQITAIKAAGYATDRHYVRTVMQNIKVYNLTQYDI
ncbi:MAG TPA: glucosaminidase domain-containing protein [Burkholderiales bacterium]|nr:glucosaminidase domain-containing protein [Burkholderiales bacterium]